VTMNSNPVGATVLVDGGSVGTTPVSLDLDNNRSYNVVFRMEGRQDVACVINRGVGAGWVILDVLGGILPVVVDAATGSWYGLSQSSCNVTLPEAVSLRESLQDRSMSFKEMASIRIGSVLR
jgi:hypothetical protein